LFVTIWEIYGEVFKEFLPRASVSKNLEETDTND
jgi:hypothetical protein